MTIKAIVFDFGEVLNAPIDPERAEERRDRLAARLGLKPDDLWSYLFDSEASKLWMTGRLDWDGFWRSTLEPRGIEDPEEIRDFTEEVFEDHDVLHPDMVELTARLKGRYKLAVLSNASRTEEEMKELFSNDFELPSDLFDTVVTSTSFGAVKPDLGIFKEVLHRLKVLPEEAVFTDDMDDFTAAAASLGIHAHTFKTPTLFRQFLGEMGVSE